ncbi:sensor of ECF-type sigma factor [Wenyingzhuangia sp. IMCC45467]
MKKQLNILAILLLFNISFYAQKNDKESREKIKSAKISFISDELSLTPKQAEKFWPIYNSFRDTFYSLYREKRDIERNINYGKITEKEAKELVEKIQDKENEINQKRIEFIKETSKIIKYKQLLKLNYAEHKFKKNLLERIKKEN